MTKGVTVTAGTKDGYRVVTVKFTVEWKSRPEDVKEPDGPKSVKTKTQEINYKTARHHPSKQAE